MIPGEQIAVCMPFSQLGRTEVLKHACCSHPRRLQDVLFQIAFIALIGDLFDQSGKHLIVCIAVLIGAACFASHRCLCNGIDQVFEFYEFIGGNHPLIGKVPDKAGTMFNQMSNRQGGI